MKNKLAGPLIGALVATAFSAALITCASAQGRGRGGGNGGGQGMGTPSGVGVNRGIGQSSDASRRRADNGPDEASMRSNGRSDAGFDRARIAGENLNDATHELSKHPGMANLVHMNANDLRNQYRVALASNPNLNFGHFVAATRLGQNLHRTHPAITRDAILAGLANGQSIGKTLQNLGLSSRESSAAKKQVEKEIEQSRH